MSARSRSLLNLHLVSAKDLGPDAPFKICVRVHTTVIADGEVGPGVPSDTVVSISSGPASVDPVCYDDDDPSSYTVFFATHDICLV